MRKAKRPSTKKASKQPGRPRVRPRWTKEEIGILRRLYKSQSNAAIAKVLGRKVSSVVFKAHRLGLAKGARRLREMGQENIRRRWDARGKPSKAGSRARGKGRRR
jgi:hypothetical protein